jgi:hypothetical protein
MPPKRALEQQESASPRPPKKAKSVAPAEPKLVGKALQLARVEILRNKISKADADGTLDASVAKWSAKPGNPRRTVDRSEGVARVMMDCKKCGKTQPLQPKFFHAHHDNLASSEVGHESFKNCLSNPCTTCWSTMQAVEISTVVGWVKNLIRKYKNLSAVWFWKQWKLQGGEYDLHDDGTITISKAALCNVSGVPMTVIHGQFTASINNRSKDHSEPHLHVEEHSELVGAWANVRQDNAFVDLKPAFLEIARESAQVQQDLLTNPNRDDVEAAELSAEIRQNWSQRDRKHLNGVSASSVSEKVEYKLQINNLDVYTICKAQATSHAQHDDDAGRVPEVPLTAENIMIKWSAAPRCAHSHVLTTIRNGPRRLSLDRTATRVAHEDSTTLVVCRMLNPPSGMSRAKWCSIMWQQTKVELTDAVRASFKAEAMLV